jgi:hypothetical protein
MNTDKTTSENKQRLVFRKSSYSPYAKNCVGVLFADEVVLVTNTKLADQRTIEFTRDEWRAFVRGVRNGEFDLPT